MKRKIWSNYDVDPADFAECDGADLDDPATQYDAEDANWSQFYDETSILNTEVLPGEIIVIADLGFWNGRHMGYRIEGEGKATTTLSDCLRFEWDCDFAEWYVKGNDLCSRQSHHDGTHYLIYRVWKPDISQKQKEFFLNKVVTQKATRRDITRYTAGLGELVKKVYGW